MTKLLLALLPVMCFLPLGISRGETPAEPAQQPVPAVEVDGADEVADIAETGRLRKLHLVRPDLIPYPVAYDIYC